jgi:hypothetical protein
MSINFVTGMKAGDLYTTDGEDVWEVVGYFDCPSVTLKNLRTGEEMTGGVGCLNFDPFVRLVKKEQPE